jgi:tetratricopeptide (TPR) repeat protein
MDYLPVTSTVLWAEWWLWGDHPAGYRVINVALHAASAVLLFWVLKKMRAPGAALAAGLFLAHPVSVGTVAWVAELKNTLSLFFALLTMAFFMRIRFERAGAARTIWWSYGLGLGCFALALLSKISVVMLPFVLAAIEYWAPKEQIEGSNPRPMGNRESGDKARAADADPDRKRRVSGKVREASLRAAKALLVTSPFFGLSFVLGLVNVWFQRHHAMAFAAGAHSEGLLPRLLAGGHALWFYLGKALLPVNLMPIYPRWHIDAHSAEAWLPAIGWVLLLAACWIGMRRLALGTKVQQICAASFFGLAFFSVTLAPVLGPIDIVYFSISRAADHLQYFALPGVAALVGVILNELLPGKDAVRKKAMALPLIVVLGVMSFQRASLYGEPQKLWRDNLARNPDAALAWANLAEILVDSGNLNEALGDFERALELDPVELVTRENFARALLLADRYDEAIRQYRVLLERKPNVARLHTNLGTALARKGELAEAMKEFETAIRLAPGLPDAHKNLGAGFYKAGMYEEAIREFQETLRIDPAFPGTRELLQQAERRAGRR